MKTKRTKVDLESALTGALQFGDNMADQIIALSRTVSRQRSVMRRAINLIRQGRAPLGVGLLEDELYRGDFK
jgi:hypothetical protein